MGFNWNKMRMTPEANYMQSELRNRSENRTLEELSNGYAHKAAEILSGDMGISVRDEISRFAKKIESTHGTEQYDTLRDAVRSLYQRKSAVFADIPDDEHERVAFVRALWASYQKTLQ